MNKKPPKIYGQRAKKQALHERLAEYGCDIEWALAQAIMKRDIPMIEALTDLMPFIMPKFKDREGEQTPEGQMPDLKLVNNENLSEWIRKAR